ncbi:hypothetical protein PIB30_023225 [Stylosanthes scabra]|uniref:Uncharacterized protein n=1 Tax=Stylosanthes scabra TaxID=79078 RepID=A0ABU6W7V9_9FABA|nr:hypothetical protein [Stylosanthes scabra]
MNAHSFKMIINPPQQQQGQQRQPYTYSQPQNNQNVRYQPPHNRQQPYPPNNPLLSVDEAMRIYQKENQEIKEIQRRTAKQIAKLYEMMQDTTNQPTQVPPPVTNSPPAQPSQNPKSGINALQHKKKKKWRDVGDGEKRSYNLWYDLIAQLANSDDEEGESEVESDEEYSGECGEDEVGSEEENKEDSDGDDDDDESEEEEEENEDWLYDLLVKLYEAQEREKENGDNQSEEESNVENDIEDVEADD